MNLPVLAQDKANHFLYGQTLFVVTYWVIWKLTGGYNWAGWGAEIVVILIGGLKELQDRRMNKRAKVQGERPPHGVEAWDWMATALGGVSIWLVVTIL